MGGVLGVRGYWHNLGISHYITSIAKGGMVTLCREIWKASTWSSQQPNERGRSLPGLANSSYDHYQQGDLQQVLHLSVPQFPLLYNKSINGTYPLRVVLQVNTLTRVKHRIVHKVHPRSMLAILTIMDEKIQFGGVETALKPVSSQLRTTHSFFPQESESWSGQSLGSFQSAVLFVFPLKVTKVSLETDRS